MAKYDISRINSLALPIWKIVIKLLILNLILFALLIGIAPTHLKVQYIPDDAFYYLTLSRNFSYLNYWTFDSGTSITSGFHLLFAYLLSGIFELLQPSSDTFVISGVVLSFLFSLATVLIGASLAFKQNNVLFLMFFGLVISSRNFIYNAISITEWSLTLLSALLYCVYYFYSIRQNLHLRNLIIFFALGCLGSLARADFGLLPFSITLGAFLLYALKLIPQNHVHFSVAGLAGAIAGAIVGIGHNYLFTMEFLHSSAKMKAFWAEVLGSNYFSVFGLSMEVLGAVGSAVVFFIAIKLLALLLYKFRTQYNQSVSTLLSAYEQKIRVYSKPEHLLMIVSSVACLLGYSIFYSRNAAIQVWYSANIIVPILLFLYGTSNFILSRLGEKSRAFLTVFLLGLSILRIINLYPLDTDESPWPYQTMMLDAGIFLMENQASFSNGQVGAWNAGIIGYYQGGHVVNLDGLVNNDIYQYAIKNDLASYLTDKNIVYLIDFERMFIDETKLTRGGYNDTNFLDKLHPVATIVGGNEEAYWNNMRLYQIID